MMELLQSVFLVCGVAGALALAVLVVKRRRQGSAWFGSPRKRRLEQLDRIALTHQHSVHLLSVEGRWLAVAVTPKGVELLESGALLGASTRIAEVVKKDPEERELAATLESRFRLDPLEPLETLLAARRGARS